MASAVAANLFLGPGAILAAAKSAWERQKENAGPAAELARLEEVTLVALGAVEPIPLPLVDDDGGGGRGLLRHHHHGRWHHHGLLHYHRWLLHHHGLGLHVHFLNLFV